MTQSFFHRAQATVETLQAEGKIMLQALLQEGLQHLDLAQTAELRKLQDKVDQLEKQLATLEAEHLKKASEASE